MPFQRQQSGFGLQTTRESGQLASGPHDTVTWSDDGNRVSAVRCADGAHGRGAPDLFGDVSI